MRIKLKNVRPLARRGRRAGDEDDLLAYLMNRNQSVYSPRGGYQVDFAPAGERDYQAVGLPGVQVVGQAPNAQARYVNQLATQISQQQGVGNNNDYYRMVSILDEIVKDKRNLNEDGSLNKHGWANLATQQFYGPGSHYDRNMKTAAKDVASKLASTALLPYMTGIGGVKELAASTLGGMIGGDIGYGIGQHFDNPYTGNYAGSELGGLVGGLTGAVAGANYRGLGRAYVRGLDNLDNKQDLYYASKGFRPDGTQPTAAEINATFPLNTTARIVPVDNSVATVPNKTYINLMSRGSKLTPLEKRGWLKSVRNSSGHKKSVAQQIGDDFEEALEERGYPINTNSRSIYRPNVNGVKASWYRRNGIVPESVSEVATNAIHDLAPNIKYPEWYNLFYDDSLFKKYGGRAKRKFGGALRRRLESGGKLSY